MQSHVSHTTVLSIYNRSDNQQKEKLKHAKPKTIKIPLCKVFLLFLPWSPEKATRKYDNYLPEKIDLMCFFSLAFIHLTKLARCLNNAFVLWPTILSFTFFAVRWVVWFCRLIWNTHCTLFGALLRFRFLYVKQGTGFFLESLLIHGNVTYTNSRSLWKYAIN